MELDFSSVSDSQFEEFVYIALVSVPDGMSCPKRSVAWLLLGSLGTSIVSGL